MRRRLALLEDDSSDGLHNPFVLQDDSTVGGVRRGKVRPRQRRQPPQPLAVRQQQAAADVHKPQQPLRAVGFVVDNPAGALLPQLAASEPPRSGLAAVRQRARMALEELNEECHRRRQVLVNLSQEEKDRKATAATRLMRQNAPITRSPVRRGFDSDVDVNVKSPMHSAVSPTGGDLEVQSTRRPIDASLDEYFARCAELGVVPAADAHRNRFSRVHVNVSAFGFGDAHLEAFASWLEASSSGIKTVNLSRNRLGSSGVASVVSRMPLTLTELNLAHNSIGLEGVKAVAAYLRKPGTGLRKLSVEDNKLRDKAVGELLRSISGNNTLTSLTISYNDLQETGAGALGRLLAANMNSLTELGVAWCGLRGSGAAAVAVGLAANHYVKTLDLSWNVFGGSDHRHVATEALAGALSHHRSLSHLDLSNNSLDERDIGLLAEGLRANHTLMGIHLAGNAASVDPRGFMSGCVGPRELYAASGSMGHIVTRILGHPAVRDGELWASSSNCWICERWREIKFEYMPGLSGRPGDKCFLFTSFDNWAGDIMPRVIGSGPSGSQESDGFVVYRMVPPGTHYYVFLLDSDVVPTIALKQKQHTWQQALVLTFSNETIKREPVRLAFQEFVNEIDVEPTTESSPSPAAAKPRLYSDSIVGPQGPFDLSKSVFAGWQEDSDAAFAAAFESEWVNTKCRRIIKDDADYDAVQDLLQKNFGVLQAIFKHYCARGVLNPFAITWNSFTELMNACSVPDMSACNLTNLDTLFIATTTTAGAKPRAGGRAISRAMFLEALVRVAQLKYVSTSELHTSVQAVDALLRDYVLPLAERIDMKMWRWKRIFNWEVNDVFKENLANLRLVYDSNSGIGKLPGEIPTMGIDEFNELLDKAAIVDADFTVREATLAFVRSMKTARDESSSEDHKRMAFVEFLIALAHVAELKDMAAEDGFSADPGAFDTDFGYGLRPFAKEGQRLLIEKISATIASVIATVLRGHPTLARLPSLPGVEGKGGRRPGGDPGGKPSVLLAGR